MSAMIKMPVKCPRCGVEFKVAVELPGRYATRCCEDNCMATIDLEVEPEQMAATT